MVSNEHKQEIGKNPNLFRSVKHALDGIFILYKEERNMRYHTLFGIVPLLLGWYYQVSAIEWILLIFCIFFVVLMEFINTMIESLVDLVVGNKYHEIAKKVKDISAGLVLLTAIFTVIVAAIIFIPKMMAQF